MATSARRQRRKERNRAQARTRTRSVRLNRARQFIYIAVIAAVIIGAVAFAVSNIGPLDPNTVITHGG